jgi:hypothetical protein
MRRAEHELPSTWRSSSRTYWARFGNVFGERFETSNPLDPAAVGGVQASDGIRSFGVLIAPGHGRRQRAVGSRRGAKAGLEGLRERGSFRVPGASGKCGRQIPDVNRGLQAP